MAGQQPDTPGHSPDRDKGWPRERATFSIDGRDDQEGSPHSAGGYEAPDQTVFDLTMDYSDEDTLLDWERYDSLRKFKCWGMDCSLVARFCPFMPCVPNEWYYRFSKKQRKLMTVGFSVFGGLLVLLVGATVLLNLLPNQDTPSGLGYANEECTWSSYHLPTSVKPRQYDLDMAVQLAEPFMVTGSVVVHAEVTRRSKCLVLHAVDMNITHMNRMDPHTHGKWRFNDQEQLILEFEDAIEPAANVSFAVHFNYTLKQGLSGFYRSNYKVGTGESRVMATTQMEANSARKAFPCFDEPALKAIWNFSLTAPANQTVLFNMPQQASAAVAGGDARRAFVPTPPMSSYLVAFVVGNLTKVSQDVAYPNGKGAARPVSIWGTPDRAESLGTALDVATKVLPEYERLFGVPYPLPKLDLVAIPDFAAGAMENWGLITYRETDLLFSANESSIQNERRVAVVVAHEMAHLWFGDLVTMKDWGELWLNEGFATYFENVGASIARPNFAYFDTFYSDYATSAMETDAYPKSTHPLATLKGMDTAERVEAMFDSISYDKGGSVLRMLRAYLNRVADPKPLLRRSLTQESPSLQKEVFLQGLQNYLEKHGLNNTSSPDLWAEMDAVVGEDVSGWMRSWTFQPGIPRVQVLLDGPGKRELHIYQAPFQFSGPKTCDASPKGVKAGAAPWWIPLASRTRDGGATTSWTTLQDCMMPTPHYTLKDDDDWIKLNAEQYGLYRVNYPDSLWDKLAAAAALPPPANKAPTIAPEDLAGLLDDSWALAEAGETPIMHFLDLAKSLGSRGASDYSPWSVGAAHIVDVHRFLQLMPEQDCAKKWSSFVTWRMMDPMLANNTQLALNSSLAEGGAGVAADVQARLLRSLLAGLSNEFNDTGARFQAQQLFQASSKKRLDADVRSQIYAFVASSGQQSDYDAIKAIYLSASEPSEKSRALAALAYAVLPAQTEATLEFAISSQVRSQDTGSLITRVAFQGGARLQAAWSFVRMRYKEISEKLGGEDEAANAMGKLINSIASRLADDKSIAEVEEVFRAHGEYLTETRLLEGAKENILANKMWNQRNGLHVCEWLDRQS